MGRYSPPGKRIQLREQWGGRTWEIREGTIVRDEPGVIAVYTAPGTAATIATGEDGLRLRLPPAGWKLRPVKSPDRHFLAVHKPGTEHTLILIWDVDWNLLCWYINLETDLERTRAGFDYVDHFLDIVVEPDMSAWRWKDEDELEEAVASGLVTADDAEAFRAEGEQALDQLLRRAAPYDEPWEDWRPEK